MQQYQYGTNPYGAPQNTAYGQQAGLQPPSPYTQTGYVQPYAQTGGYGMGAYVDPAVTLDPHHNTYDAHHGNNQDKFRYGSECRDLFWVILFFIHLAGLGAIIGVGLMKEVPEPDSHTGFLPYNTTNGGDPHALVLHIEIAAILVVISLIVSIIYLQLMKMYTKALIYIGMGFTLALFIGIAIWSALQGGGLYGTIISAIFVLILAFYFWTIKNRIPFAVEVIKSVVDVVTRYPATQVVSYVSIFFQIGWIFLWSFALILAQRFERNLSILALVFLIFSFYWVSEVLKNIVHVSVSGVIATSYFLGDMMPENPTLGALKRSLTTSFGSICLGSLIVSVLKTLRTLIRMVRSENNNLLLCLADCLLGCIDSLVQYFNHYAFCQVAIYGKTFVEAARSTWELIKHSGLEAIANDNLVDGVLWVGVFFNAILTAAAGVGVAFVFGQSYLIYGIIGFIIGFVIMILGMQVIDSGVACTFVCFAEDREVLRRSNPHLYNKFVETYSLHW
jgi:hypothetical protein